MKRLLLLLVLLFAAPAIAEPRTGKFTEKILVAEALGPSPAPDFAAAFGKKAKLELQVYVPPTYDPAKPAGVVAYISPLPSGAIPDRWKPAMEARNLIWVGVRNSGNRSAVTRRVAETLMATAWVTGHYEVDHDRIFLTGFSGGGRVASMMAYYYGNFFAGALYICGVNTFPEDDPALIAAMRQNAYVFLTGTGDFNRRDTQEVYATYEAAGFENITLTVVPRLDHELPRAPEFAAALDWLDGGNAPR